jgi:hypothetical protein
MTAKANVKMNRPVLGYREVALSGDPDATRRRLALYRRVRDQLIADRGGDPTAALEALADSAAALVAYCADQVEQLLRGVPKDMSQLQGSMNTLRRMLETIGIERKPKDVTTLENYLERAKMGVKPGNGYPTSN